MIGAGSFGRNLVNMEVIRRLHRLNHEDTKS